MKIAFAQGKDAAATLADNGRGDAIVIEAWGVDGVVEKVPMADSPTKLLLSHQNVDGPFTFAVRLSPFDTVDEAAAYFAQEAARQGIQDRVTIENGAGAVIAIMDDALLQSVHRVAWKSVDLTIRYTFAITTITTST